MIVQDIITYAACNSGVTPSFNQMDVPQDVRDNALAALTMELIPQMNADRSLDVSTTSILRHPVGNEIRLEQGAGPDDFQWVPGRVDAVQEAPSGMPYTYLYMKEFYSIDYKFMPYMYTQELTENGLIIRFRQTNTQKRLIIPIPFFIEGPELHAPPKFNQFLIDTLAAKLAHLYGMTTLPQMIQARDVSYNMLLKQTPEPVKAVNPRMRIRDVLKNGQSRYWRFDGFV